MMYITRAAVSDAEDALKHLIDHQVKEIFTPFTLIGQSNASKYLQRPLDRSRGQ